MSGASLPDNSIDHVVYATGDVSVTSALIEQRTGVAPSRGGPHQGRGTWNTLCSFGPGTYLEVIGPDPTQPEPAVPRPFALDSLTRDGIVGWCVRRSGLDSVAAKGNEFDVAFVGPVSMSRAAPEGRLEWDLLYLGASIEPGLIPFFIDWRGSPHPSLTAASGLRLDSLTAEHPHPQRILRLLLALDLTLEVREGDRAGLTAAIAGPAGTMVVAPAGFD